jgi:hypothetical protein
MLLQLAVLTHNVLDIHGLVFKNNETKGYSTPLIFSTFNHLVFCSLILRIRVKFRNNIRKER